MWSDVTGRRTRGRRACRDERDEGQDRKRAPAENLPDQVPLMAVPAFKSVVSNGSAPARSWGA